MAYNITSKIRTFCLMVIAMLLLATNNTYAGFLVKKEAASGQTVTGNHSNILRLSDKLSAFKAQRKMRFIDRLHIIRNTFLPRYGEKSGGNLLSILSLVCGCVSAFSLFLALVALVLTLSASISLYIAIGSGALAIAAILLGAVALSQGQTKGMAIAGIILGSVIVCLLGFVALIIASF